MQTIPHSHNSWLFRLCVLALMHGLLALCGLCSIFLPRAWGQSGADSLSTAVDMYCLRAVYPAGELRKDSQGRLWLDIKGRAVLYRGHALGGEQTASQATDIATSMAQAYVPDVYAAHTAAPRVATSGLAVPERELLPPAPAKLVPALRRPATPAGYAPGRQRSMALLRALYGSDAAAVKKQLCTVRLAGQNIRLSGPAAEALRRVDRHLQAVLAQKPHLRRWLHNDGGFVWRSIAGEQNLSPHAFGIALDLSARETAYWRWSRQRPHPQQQTYPEDIVRAFEAEGFIWGGKWHEYDTMHFEYRPELLCKARVHALLARLQKLVSRTMARQGGQTGDSPAGDAKNSSAGGLP